MIEAICIVIKKVAGKGIGDHTKHDETKGRNQKEAFDKAFLHLL
jgi:hypothetical protein